MWTSSGDHYSASSEAKRFGSLWAVDAEQRVVSEAGEEEAS